MHNRIAIQTNDNNLLYISNTKIDDKFQTVVHSHPNAEILLVIEGEGMISFTNHQERIKKGDLIIINPNSNHKESSNSSIQFYAIGLNKTNFFLNDDFKNKIIPLSLNKNEYMLINSIYESIYEEASNKKNKYQEVIDNMLSSLIIFIERKECIYHNNENNDEKDLVASIKAIIDNNYSTEIKLDEIAKRLSLSISTICHEFKKSEGISIIEYKVKKQLEEANNLLKNSSMSVSEIAYFVGFNNVSYFNKQFKKEYLSTPLKYKSNTK